MSRILLADDSPHAQRMGERILRDEGHEVITVSDGRVAMLRLQDADPDLIIADVSMPEVSGFELCEYVKSHGGGPVILTAGAVEPVDEVVLECVRADGILKKPFGGEPLWRRSVDLLRIVRKRASSACGGRRSRTSLSSSIATPFGGHSRSGTGSRRRDGSARFRDASPDRSGHGTRHCGAGRQENNP